MLHPPYWSWSLLGGMSGSATAEYHWTMNNTFCTFKDTSCEACISVNSANWFWIQFHHRYFWIALYQKYEEPYWSANKANYIRQMLKLIRGVQVLTVIRKHCHILPIKAGMIVTLQKYAVYYPQPINCEIPAEHIICGCSIIRKSNVFSLWCNRYIIRVEYILTECAEVSYTV